jgi:hypothetical protein
LSHAAGSNLGLGHGAINGGAGYTYFDPTKGHEFSAVAGFTYNFMKPTTNFQSGVDFHLDWGASQLLSKQFSFGLVGYARDGVKMNLQLIDRRHHSHRLSAASCNRRDAVIDSRATSATTAPNPLWRSPSSKQANTVLSSPKTDEDTDPRENALSGCELQFVQIWTISKSNIGMTL